MASPWRNHGTSIVDSKIHGTTMVSPWPPTIGPPWRHDGAAMVGPQRHGATTGEPCWAQITIVLPGWSHGGSIVPPWPAQSTMVFSWRNHGGAMVDAKHHGVATVSPWRPHGASMVARWRLHGVTTPCRLLQNRHGVKTKLRLYMVNNVHHRLPHAVKPTRLIAEHWHPPTPSWSACSCYLVLGRFFCVPLHSTHGQSLSNGFSSQLATTHVTAAITPPVADFPPSSKQFSLQASQVLCTLIMLRGYHGGMEPCWVILRAICSSTWYTGGHTHGDCRQAINLLKYCPATAHIGGGACQQTLLCTTAPYTELEAEAVSGTLPPCRKSCLKKQIFRAPTFGRSHTNKVKNL